MIEEACFWETSVTQIHIPKSVQVIGNGAFSQCNELRRLVFSEGSQLAMVGNDAFINC